MPEGRGVGGRRAEVADATERFHLLVDAVDEYAIFMLDAEGVIMTWNEGAARLKGYTADEVIGRHLSLFYTADEVAADKPARNLAEAAVKGTTHDEGWRVRKDGTRFWANVTLTALVDDDGSLRGFAKVTRDETDRMKADRQVRELELLTERERIAADLHQRIIHRLFEASLLIEGALRLVRDPAVESRMTEAMECLDVTVKEIRATIHDLGSPTPPG